MEEFAFRFIETLVGVGPEEVSLGLKEVSREALGAIAIVVGKRSTKAWNRDAIEGRDGNNLTPVLLGIGKDVREERSKHKVSGS